VIRPVDPPGRLADASWANRVRAALPNGVCGLPRQQTCPHSNKCLTCPVFVTTGEHLPVHKAHRDRTAALVEQFEANGQTSSPNRTRKFSTTSIGTSPDSRSTTATARVLPMRADNTAALCRAAQQRSHDTLTRAAIRRLAKTGEPVTFNTVAREARVSRAWLYAGPDIRTAIEQLRDSTLRSANATPVPANQRASDVSLLRRLETASNETESLPTRSAPSEIRLLISRANSEPRSAADTAHRPARTNPAAPSRGHPKTLLMGLGKDSRLANS
jgi:hypothetical protein